MAQCPFCQTDIGDDFGLIECSSCHKVSFVEIDGQVKIDEQTDEQTVAFEQPDFEAGIEIATAETSEESLNLDQFANSEASRGRDGNLRYSVTISGIDTGELRTRVLEALTDKKFLWDVNALIKSIRAGELTLSDVSAVKAALLVSRLRSFSLDVHWEQHALHQD
jgi:hypothetical protein